MSGRTSPRGRPLAPIHEAEHLCDRSHASLRACVRVVAKLKRRTSIGPTDLGDGHVQRANLGNARCRENNDRQFDNCHREVKCGRKGEPRFNPEFPRTVPRSNNCCEKVVAGIVVISSSSDLHHLTSSVGAHAASKLSVCYLLPSPLRLIGLAVILFITVSDMKCRTCAHWRSL